MPLIKQTSTGDNFIEKIHTDGDGSALTSMQLYNKQDGSDGASSNTVFTLPSIYAPGTHTLMVFVNGQKVEQVSSASNTSEYEETNYNTVTFGASLQDADVVEFTVVGTYVESSGPSSSTEEKEMTDFDIDSVMTGAENSNVWNMASSMRFSPLVDGAIWTTFRVLASWDVLKDIKFKLFYTISSTDTGDVSMNASFWVVEDGDVPAIGSPDVTVEDELTMGTINQLDVVSLTNIKVPNNSLSTADSLVIMKLWRDVNGVVDNHNGWLEMVKLIAYQD